MKTLLNSIVFSTLFGLVGFSQSTTETFNFTGGIQTWTVPQCVTSIDVVVAGAEGGGVSGGDGAVVSMTITVTPGQVIEMNVGGQGVAGGPGYGGGGTGHLSYNPANANWNSYGGGGATTLTIGGSPYIIAAGGGGTGGGSNNVAGGAGGCATGVTGTSTFGSGGGGGTQVSGGAGGVPWAGTPPGGSPGALGQGGQGGIWDTASGGGGGGGYYGGGGGGNDGCCTNANGGGGGGGGSSLVPAGAGCLTGSNTGNGYVSITYIGALNATASNTGDYCAGETVQLNASGGTDFSWTGPNGFTSNLQNPTIPNSTTANSGVYTVIVTDINCPGADTATTTVLVKPMPDVDPTVDQVICNGSTTTAVNFTGSVAGTTFNWFNSNTGTGLGSNGVGNIPAFTGTAPTTTQVSTITVTPTLNGCTGIADTFTITVLPDPTLTVSNDTLICQNGTAYLVATAAGGGGGPYIYHWGHTNDTQGTQTENPVSATTYTVYAESPNGCISDVLDIEVTVRDPLTGTISDWDTVCPTYSTNLTATVTGGLGTPYTFVWSSGETQTGPNNHTITVTPTATTTYTVTVTDECESTPLVMQTVVRVAPVPDPQYTVLNPEQCEPAVFDIVNSTDPSMSQYVYWLVDGDQQFVNQDTITTGEFWAGEYDIHMVVTSYEGCVDSITVVGALDVRPRPIADFKYSPNPVLMFNTDVYFMNYSFDGYSYQWFFEEGAPATSTQENVKVKFPYGEVGSYEVTLITTSALGCSDTTVQTIVVFPEVLIYAPNTFTPDGDEYNQDWRVYMEGIDVYDFELLIFDRWGEIVWESHDIEVPWDGTYNGKKVQAGTYNWVIRTKDMLNDSKYTYNGHVTILR